MLGGSNKRRFVVILDRWFIYGACETDDQGERRRARETARVGADDGESCEQAESGRCPKTEGSPAAGGRAGGAVRTAEQSKLTLKIKLLNS